MGNNIVPSKPKRYDIEPDIAKRMLEDLFLEKISIESCTVLDNGYVRKIFVCNGNTYMIDENGNCINTVSKKVFENISCMVDEICTLECECYTCSKSIYYEVEWLITQNINVDNLIRIILDIKNIRAKDIHLFYSTWTESIILTSDKKLKYRDQDITNISTYNFTSDQSPLCISAKFDLRNRLGG